MYTPFERGLPYDSAVRSSDERIPMGRGSRNREVCFGLSVLPMNFSPEGERGGVYPLGDVWLWVWILDMKMGDGGAASDGPGLFTSLIS